MPSSGVQTCARSEEHTSELQSHDNLVCRLLLEKTDDHRAVVAEPVLLVPTLGAGDAPRALGDGGAEVGAQDLGGGAAFFFFLSTGGPPEPPPFPPPGLSD